MLVLTRRANETIQIGEDIRVPVVSIEGDRVRIGIEAPRDQKIYRLELLQEVTAINKEAASAPADIFSLGFDSQESK